MGEYVPYGPEWEKEMMKWNKKRLVEFLKNVISEKKLYSIATVDTQSDMGSHWEILKIKRLGVYSEGEFPPFFRDKISAEEWLSNCNSVEKMKVVELKIV